MSEYMDDYQLTHDMIFGSGVITQSRWWLELLPMHPKADNGSVPSYWGYRLSALNPGDSDATPIECEIFHSTLITAFGRIAAGAFGDREGLLPVSGATRGYCHAFLEDPVKGSNLFNASSADEVLQVIAYGGIVEM